MFSPALGQGPTRNSHTGFKAPSLLHPFSFHTLFFNFQLLQPRRIWSRLLSSVGPSYSAWVHLLISYWGAIGLISSIPFFWACRPALPVVHVPKQLLHIFCPVLYLFMVGGQVRTTHHGQKQKTQSLYCIHWNSEACEFLLIMSCVESCGSDVNIPMELIVV